MDNYGQDWAENYKRLAAASIPGREGLYRLCSAFLSELSGSVHILVVGCGTGDELIGLAKALPQAKFEGIDPSEAMLELCKKRVEEEKLSNRIKLHQATLEEFLSPNSFDAVTSVLVSQHLESDTHAQDFFHQLASHLKPDGFLYSADLSIASDQDRELLFNLWRSHVIMSGIDEEMAEAMLTKIQSDISIRDQATISKFIHKAGFKDIFSPFRSLMYGTWAAKKMP